MVDSNHTPSSDAIAASFPGQGAKAKDTFAAYLQSGEGKVKFDRLDSVSPAGRGAVLVARARNRVESVDTPPRNRGTPVLMSMEDRAQIGARGMNG